MLLHNHNLEILLTALQWDDSIQESKKASYTSVLGFTKYKPTS